MATEKVKLMVVTDDLTGQEGASPRTFALDATWYQLDLTDESWDALVALLLPYTSVAKPGLPPRREVDPAEAARRVAIRKWANRQGIWVGARGRIPHEIEAAYSVSLHKQEKRRSRAAESSDTGARPVTDATPKEHSS